MIPNLSGYPPTKKGAEDLVGDLTPTIIRLWKAEREIKSDDLVAVIDANANSVNIKSRSGICTQLKRHSPKSDLLSYLSRPAVSPRPNGTISIWAVVGFTDDKVCVLPVVLARS